jgi:hypothetical protein
MFKKHRKQLMSFHSLNDFSCHWSCIFFLVHTSQVLKTLLEICRNKFMVEGNFCMLILLLAFFPGRNPISPYGHNLSGVRGTLQKEVHVYDVKNQQERALRKPTRIVLLKLRHRDCEDPWNNRESHYYGSNKLELKVAWWPNYSAKRIHNSC